MEIKNFDIWKSQKIRNHLYIVDAASDRYPKDQDLFIHAAFTTKEEAIQSCRNCGAKYAEVVRISWTDDGYEPDEDILFSIGD